MQHLPNFDIETVRTFFAVSQSRNFTDAAALLHKTPAAVSYRIRTLEKQFGVQLFERMPHHLELTAAGSYLKSELQKVYSLLEDIPTQLVLLGGGVESHYKIVVNNLLIHGELYCILQDIGRQFPCTDFHVTVQKHHDMWTKFLDESYDLALGLPQFEGSLEDISILPWGTCRWALSKLKDETKDRENKSLKEVMIATMTSESNEQLRAQWNNKFQQIFFVTTIEQEIESISRGIGVGFLPEQFVKQSKSIVEVGSNVVLGKMLFQLAVRHPQSPISKLITQILKERTNLFFLQPY